jgi:hypothetical protein
MRKACLGHIQYGGRFSHILESRALHMFTVQLLGKSIKDILAMEERSIGRLKEVKDEGVTWDNIIEPRE